MTAYLIFVRRAHKNQRKRHILLGYYQNMLVTAQEFSSLKEAHERLNRIIRSLFRLPRHFNWGNIRMYLHNGKYNAYVENVKHNGCRCFFTKDMLIYSSNDLTDSFELSNTIQNYGK